MVGCSCPSFPGHWYLWSRRPSIQRSSGSTGCLSSCDARHRADIRGCWIRDAQLVRLVHLDDDGTSAPACRPCCPDGPTAGHPTRAPAGPATSIIRISPQVQRCPDGPTAGHPTRVSAGPATRIIRISPQLTPTRPRTITPPPGRYLLLLLLRFHVLFFLIFIFFIFFIIGEVLRWLAKNYVRRKHQPIVLDLATTFTLYGYTIACNYVHRIYGPIWYLVASVGVGHAFLLCPTGTTGNPVTHVVSSIACDTPIQKLLLRIGVHLAGSLVCHPLATLLWQTLMADLSCPGLHPEMHCMGHMVKGQSVHVATKSSQPCRPSDDDSNCEICGSKSRSNSSRPCRCSFNEDDEYEEECCEDAEPSACRPSGCGITAQVRQTAVNGSKQLAYLFDIPPTVCRKELRLRHNILVTKKPKYEPDNICCDNWTDSTASHWRACLPFPKTPRNTCPEFESDAWRRSCCEGRDRSRSPAVGPEGD